MHCTLAVAALVFPLVFAAPFRLPDEIFRRQENTTCNLSETPQPSNTLAPPGADLTLALIAVGHGTQNYTCANSSAATTPAAIGAVASLFNASCAVADNLPELGTIIEDTASIGTHFFVDNTTPEFDIIGLGETQAKKVEAVPAPSAADVPWLRLEAQQQGTTSPVKQIYRLNTKGGVAPTNCEGRAAGETITVEYEAQYWIYASASELAARKKRSLDVVV
ncbi:hypothetical protein DM02DRAFT_609193 [Periconia macrospinosa]|uniref:Malate dehydrogenase n=1 Tax=Periconia macrospinosa TaxID=97972 RepID=A0A2V1EB03_9PLEO|nr:hypothetical protein DM02DRAFT_609193 [Periconia macrospinosa]